MSTTTQKPDRTDGGGAARQPRWSWAVPAIVVAVGFLAFSLPPYLTFDPDRSRVPVHDGFALHYPLLVAHILFGSVALLTCCLQMWPWLRRRRPDLHRWAGRAYVFGGVLPASIALLGVAPLSSTGFVSQVGNTMLAILWLPVTWAGYRAARRRRYREHREWMIRSFALTTSIVVNRVWVALMILVLIPQRDTTFAGDETALVDAAAGASVWTGWVVNLLVAEWWLHRRRGARATGERTTGQGRDRLPIP